jgi:hypothetical protein
MRQVAKYTVTFTREIGQEDGQEDYGVHDDATGIKQLRDEIQEAFDQGYLVGNFNIEDRKVEEVK